MKICVVQYSRTSKSFSKRATFHDIAVYIENENISTKTAYIIYKFVKAARWSHSIKGNFGPKKEYKEKKLIRFD